MNFRRLYNPCIVKAANKSEMNLIFFFLNINSIKFKFIIKNCVVN